VQLCFYGNYGYTYNYVLFKFIILVQYYNNITTIKIKKIYEIDLSVIISLFDSPSKLTKSSKK